MRLYQKVALLAAVAGSMALGAPKKAPADLGKVLYIGDSITHGFGAPSYRWPLHKIFVDNGISYEEIGVETGNRRGGETLNPDTPAVYIGRTFQNRHAAMSGERAYEVSNRRHDASKRLDDTSIFHWFELPKDAEGKDITAVANRTLGGAVPDTCFIMLGTNDMLSDYGDKGGIAKHIGKAMSALLDKKKGDICVIVNVIRQKNPKAKVVMLSVPTWVKRQQNSTEKDFSAVVKGYNKKLAMTFKKDTVVDLNQGLVDICNTELPYSGVPNFFNAHDKLHPTPQGDLIIAGLVARTMGYAGRSAGAPRKAASGFSSPASALLERATEKTNVEPSGEGLSLKAGAKLVAPWQEGAETEKGFTVELQMNVGNGAAGGWDKEDCVVLSVGNGTQSAQLKLREGYILWHNGAVLYPISMNEKKIDPIRVMWIPGSETQGVAPGFYVWLGDMLIGEGLPSNKDKFNGIGIENVSSRDEVVKHLAAEDKPVAPATKGMVKEETLVTYDDPQPADAK